MIDFYSYSKQFKNILNSNSDLLAFIFDIGSHKKNLIISPREIMSIIDDNDRKIAAVENFKKIIIKSSKEILDIVRKKRPNQIFIFINRLISELNIFDQTYNDQNMLIKEIKDFSEKHTDAYSEKRPEYIYQVADLSFRITDKIMFLIQNIDFIINYFESRDKDIPKDYINLVISSDKDIPTINEFVTIFKNIEELYNFVCHLLIIDKIKFPLIMNHISSGSWYTDILGSKRAIECIENLLKGIGTFIRDFITGKLDLEKFQNKCKKTKSFLDLLKYAKDNKIDNAELGIFKYLNPIVDSFKENTTKVDVNGEDILKLKKHEKLTLLERDKKRDILIHKIDGYIEEKKK